MKLLRSKILTSLLFCLITIGQGYSFGYLYDLYTQKNSFGLDQSSSNLLSQNPNQLLVCHEKWKVALSENPVPQKTHQEIFSFKTEPFLARLIAVKNPVFLSESLIQKIGFVSSFRLDPETPPPRG